jgi:carbon-monoxide dehydrogenase medium subunit
VKPAPFDYAVPGSVDEAVALLADAGPQASVLAGGQSLLIELRYRERRPPLLVDINRIPHLGELAVDGRTLHVGALVRHAQLEHARFTDPLAGLLREVGRHIGHPPIRSRGTFAGSLAWAHPAAEWGALAMALQAQITVRGPGGDRRVPAQQWFRGARRTDRRPDELVTSVALPLLAPGTVTRFAEHRRTHGSFAMAAVVVAVRLAQGRIEWARIGLANAAEVPLRAVAAEQVLVGGRPTLALFQEAGHRASAEADPIPEPYCSVEYRRHVLAVLVRRCLTEVIEEAGHPWS